MGMKEVCQQKLVQSDSAHHILYTCWSCSSLLLSSVFSQVVHEIPVKDLCFQVSTESSGPQNVLYHFGDHQLTVI